MLKTLWQCTKCRNVYPPDEGLTPEESLSECCESALIAVTYDDAPTWSDWYARHDPVHDDFIPED